MTKLTNESSIAAWREEKTRIDVPVKDILGCVGEPLAQFIPDTVEGREAATEARDNLLGLVNEQRESAAEEYGAELYARLEYLDNEDICSELSTDDSLNDAADKAFAHAAFVVMHECYYNTEISDSDLG